MNKIQLCKNCNQAMLCDQCFECGYQANQKQIVGEDFQNKRRDSKQQQKITRINHQSDSELLKQRRHQSIQKILSKLAEFIQGNENEIFNVCSQYVAQNQVRNYKVVVAAAVHGLFPVQISKLVMKHLKVLPRQIMKLDPCVCKKKHIFSNNILSQIVPFFEGKIRQYVHQSQEKQLLALIGAEDQLVSGFEIGHQGFQKVTNKSESIVVEFLSRLRLIKPIDGTVEHQLAHILKHVDIKLELIQEIVPQVSMKKLKQLLKTQ